MDYKMYLDLDGTITDFERQLAELLDRPLERGYDFGNDPKVWAKISQAGKEFWTKMKWMPDGHELWDYVKKYDPTILSSPTRHPSSVEGKKEWLKENLPGVPAVIESKKEKYAEKDAILIDDRKKNIKKWEEAGGIGILHDNAKKTIEELSKILDRSKEAKVFKFERDPADKIPRPRMQDVFTPRQVEKWVPPKKGKGSIYKRQKEKKFDWDSEEKRAQADRVILSYMSQQIRQHPIVVDPYDSIVQQAVMELGPNLGHIEVIKLEPTCSGNRLAWVSNTDLIEGRPGKQRVIHLCLKKIKDKFKGQHGESFSITNPAQQSRMKEIIKELLKDVILPHEAEHIRQEMEHGGEFGPSAEPEAERAEEWRKLEQMGVVKKESSEKMVDIGEKRMDHYHKHPKILLDKELLDKIRVKYLGEAKGMKFYYVDGDLLRKKVDIDAVLGFNPGRYSYVPEGELWMEDTPVKEDHTPTFLHEYKEMRKMIDEGWSYDKAHAYASGIESKYRLQGHKPSDNPVDDFKKYFKEKDASMYDLLMNKAVDLDAVADKLENQGLIKEAVYLDVLSNTIEKTAMGGLLKSLATRIPGASQIKTKEQAMGMLWDAVKKIGAQKVIEAIDLALKVLSKNPQPDMAEREAAGEDFLSQIIRHYGYPILFISALLLGYWVGKPYLEHVKQQVQHTMQSSPQQQALDELMKQNP